jgi:hypothetical protein
MQEVELRLEQRSRATQEQLPRRKNWRIKSYATILTTRNMTKKASKSAMFFAGNCLSIANRVLAVKLSEMLFQYTTGQEQ